MSLPESTPAVRSRRFPKLRRRLIVLGVLAAAYVLAGFFVVPPVVRAQAEKRLSKALSRPVSILKVRFNPLTFSCEVTGFEVRDPKGGDFFGWRRLSANFDPLKRLLGAWTFKEIELDGFHANIQRDASGHLNFADLVAKQAETSPGTPHSPSKPLPAVSIGHVAVTDARLHFEDAGVPTPFSTDLGPLTFSLRNFTTSREATAPYSFSATSETGENLSWTGTLEPEALRSSGEFALTNLKLPKYAPYYEGLVRFKLRSGDLSVKAHYDFTLAEASPDMRLSNGSVTVQSLELNAPNASELHIRMNEISATDIEADLKSRKVAIGELHLAGGTIEANRKPDGIDLIGLMLPKGQPDPLQSAVVPPAEAGVSSASTATQEAQAPWSLTVKQIDVARFDALLTDRTLETPAKFQIRNLTSHLAPLRIHRLDDLSHVDLKFDLEGGGEVSIRGNAAIHPLAANLTVSIQQLPVAQINPYLQSR
ncbi:MAG: DUF748 domain-containing protein, partial [Opitutaceae bacterium]|nr:DUF748 domain-containing protein [Opitutaceae bacterium]